MTYADIINGLSALTVTGVARKYTEPPNQLTSADLPAMYPRLPEGNQEVVGLTGEMGLLSVTCELVIVVNALMQSTNRNNFSTCVALLDALNTALTAQITTLKMDRWTLRQEDGLIGDTAYWLIIARVEASG